MYLLQAIEGVNLCFVAAIHPYKDRLHPLVLSYPDSSGLHFRLSSDLKSAHTQSQIELKSYWMVSLEGLEPLVYALLVIH